MEVCPHPRLRAGRRVRQKNCACVSSGLCEQDARASSGLRVARLEDGRRLWIESDLFSKRY